MFSSRNFNRAELITIDGSNSEVSLEHVCIYGVVIFYAFCLCAARDNGCRSSSSSSSALCHHVIFVVCVALTLAPARIYHGHTFEFNDIICIHVCLLGEGVGLRINYMKSRTQRVALLKPFPEHNCVSICVVLDRVGLQSIYSIREALQ